MLAPGRDRGYAALMEPARAGDPRVYQAGGRPRHLARAPRRVQPAAWVRGSADGRLPRRLRHLQPDPPAAKLLWLVASLFLSFALEPAVNWLVKRDGDGHGGTGAVQRLLIGLLIVALMVPLVIDQVQELIQRVPDWLEEASVYTERWFNVELTSQEILEDVAGAQADNSEIATNVASVGALLLGLVFQVLTIGLFTFYLVAEGPRFRRAVCSLLPPRRQHEILAAWDVAIDKTGGYLYSRLLLAVINAGFSFIVLQALGVPFALPLAIWQGFVSQFIPVVGTYIAAAIPLLVALLEDPWAALFFLIFVVVYQQIENYFLAPRITARTMQLHPAVAFGAALAGGAISGLIGAFLALPAAAGYRRRAPPTQRHDVVDTELTREDAGLRSRRTTKTPA
jgi:predicted PurR-regulated permease PerM